LAGVTLGAAAIQSLHAQAKSKAYIITEVEIINQEAFNEFSPKVAEATKADGGTYLARGGKVHSAGSGKTAATTNAARLRGLICSLKYGRGLHAAGLSSGV
jgi:hypothetical protein